MGKQGSCIAEKRDVGVKMAWDKMKQYMKHALTQCDDDVDQDYKSLSIALEARSARDFVLMLEDILFSLWLIDIKSSTASILLLLITLSLLLLHFFNLFPTRLGYKSPFCKVEDSEPTIHKVDNPENYQKTS
jgi:hypothetical protein